MHLMRKAMKKLTHRQCNDLSHHLVLQQSIRDRIAHVVHTTCIVAKEMESKKNSGEFMIHVAESHSQSITDLKSAKIKFISFHYLHTMETITKATSNNCR